MSKSPCDQMAAYHEKRKKELKNLKEYLSINIESSKQFVYCEFLRRKIFQISYAIRFLEEDSKFFEAMKKDKKECEKILCLMDTTCRSLCGFDPFIMEFD